MIQTKLERGGGFLAKHPEPAPGYYGSEPPPIMEQTDWPCQYFDFSKSDLPNRAGVDYFNCALVDRPDGRFLIVRRSEWRHDMMYGMNDVVAFELDGVTPTKGKPILMPAYHRDEHFEDPRAIQIGDTTYISCCNFVWAPCYSGAHQMVAAVRGDWIARNRYDPIYGGNGVDCYRNSRSEKNWLWFEHDRQPHLIYLSQPLQIAVFDSGFKLVRHYQTAALTWQYGEIRGGTPPVRIGDEYWTFFHSSVPWPVRGTRRYHMGVYAFSAKPPHKMTRITKLPLLSGSPYDRYDHPKPLVVFPCGALYRGGQWLVSFGVNDLNSAYIRIPHSDLVELTVAK